MEMIRPLNDLTFEELKKIVKLPVMDENGRRLGTLDKIHVDAKKMVAKSAEIKFDSGKKKKVSATHLFYVGGTIIYSKNGIIKRTPTTSFEMEPDLAKAKGIFDKVKTIRERILKLDELLVQGKITEATFKILRNDYESQLKTLEELSTRYVERLKNRLVELEKTEVELSEKLNIYEARLYVGEITQAEYDKLTRNLKVELDKVKTQAKMIREFLQDYAEQVPLTLATKEETEREEETTLREEPEATTQNYEEDEVEDITSLLPNVDLKKLFPQLDQEGSSENEGEPSKSLTQ